MRHMRTLLIGLALFQSVLLHAQTAPAKLDLRTRDNRRIFRIGEIIPLELRFSASAPCQMDGRNYDRGGRLDFETYTVQPRSGWEDPLERYFRDGVFMSGGVGPIYTLSSDPILITADLNEWVRFDRPGEYRLTVQSSRIQGHPVTSNEVRLTIVDPTPEWQAEILRQAVAGVPSSGPAGPSPIRILRFLGTPAAARELAHCLNNVECVLGLAGTPARKAALEEIDKLGSNLPANAWVACLMSVLRTP